MLLEKLFFHTLLFALCYYGIFIIVSYMLMNPNHRLVYYNLLNNSVKLCKINQIPKRDAENLHYFKANNDSRYLILIYTPYFRSLQWSFFLPSNCNFNAAIFQITYEKEDFNKSDLVLFHSRDMPVTSELECLYTFKKKFQIWIYFTHESILNNPPVFDINRFFEMTAIYGAGGDIYMPYRFHKNVKNKRNNIRKNYYKNKTREVAWLVSKCNNQERNELARKLISYGVQFEIVGKCSYLFKPPKPWSFSSTWSSCRDKSCNLDLNSFKFFYAAENTLCDGYITEKYWQYPFNYDMIPIVLGGSNYSDQKLAIPGSFIDAMSFASPKALAKHILAVGRNSNKYNSYFEWKNNWKLDSENLYCSFCEALLKGVKLRNNTLSLTMNIQKCSIPKQKFNDWISKVS